MVKKYQSKASHLSESKKNNVKNKSGDKMKFLTFDRAILVLLFISLVFFVQSFLFIGEEKLERDAALLIEHLTSKEESVTVLQNHELDIEKLQTFAGRDYEEIKELFAVDSDFCFYFEDETGTLLPIDEDVMGVGSEKISINGEPCE